MTRLYEISYRYNGRTQIYRVRASSIYQARLKLMYFLTNAKILTISEV